MKSSSNTITRIIGFIIFLVGMLAAFLMLVMSAWGDIEASTFDAAIRPEENLNSLNCPVFITKDETGIITAQIENPSDRVVTPRVRSRISMGFATLMDEQTEEIEIGPKETRDIEWEISRGNAAYHRVVLVRIYQFPNLSLPSRGASCGIVVLPFSGRSGQQVFNLVLASSSAAMILGLVLYIRNKKDETKSTLRTNRAYVFLGSFLVAAALVSLVGRWPLSTLLVAFAFLSLIVVFSYAATAQ